MNNIVSSTLNALKDDTKRGTITPRGFDAAYGKIGETSTTQKINELMIGRSTHYPSVNK